MLSQDEPGPVVAVTVQLTYEDYRFLQRLLIGQKSRLLGWFWYGLLVVVFALCVMRIVSKGPSNLGWDGWVGLSCLGFALIWPFYGMYAVSKTWRTSPNLRQTIRYTFTPSCLRVVTQMVETKMKWDAIVAAERAESLVLLHLDNKAYYAIPLAAFKTDDDCRVFQQLVEALVPKSKL